MQEEERPENRSTALPSRHLQSAYEDIPERTGSQGRSVLTLASLPSTRVNDSINHHALATGSCSAHLSVYLANNAEADKLCEYIAIARQ